MAKKKFSETKIGAFLTKAAPGILNVAGDILPDAGAFGLIKNLIIKDEKMPPEDKEKALLLLKQDITEMEEISKRWMYDLKSDSWLSKNTRPMALIFLTVSMVLLIFSDISSRVIIFLVISFPDGSPTKVVPPPTRAIVL